MRDSLRALSPGRVSAFSRETGLLLVAIGLLNGSNYVFHIAVSRQLGPSDYGALAALLAVLLVLSIPLAVLQTVVAQRTSALRARDRSGEVVDFAQRLTGSVIPVVLVATVASLALAAPLLSLFLDVSFASSSLLAPYVLLGTLLAIPLGVLQGTMRFAAFSVVVLVGVAVRLASGIGLVEAGLGVPGAMLATSFAAAASLALGIWLTGLRGGWVRRAVGPLESMRDELRLAILGLTSFWLLAQADIALARHYLGSEEAGFYSSAGLLARALLFMPAAVAFVAFPRIVAARERGEDTSQWLRKSLLLSGGLVLAGLVVLVPFRDIVVEITFGERYLPAAELVPLLSLAMAALALAGLLTYFHVAMGSRAYVISLAGLVAEILLVALFHSTAEQIALMVALVAAAVVVAQYAAARSLCRWRPPHELLARAPGSGQLAAEPTMQLSVVLPCHNVGNGLGGVLADLVHELDQVDSYEVIVVSDGSTDETVAIAEDFPSDGVRVLHYPERGGKGYALQVGLTEARGRYIAFIDADGDIGPEAIRPFLTIMEMYEPDVVLGSKRHPLSEVNYPPLRRLMSWGYHKLTRLLFRVKVRDTQTGLKLVRREVLADVLPRLYEKRYAFDLELLVVARQLGYTRVFEAPVRIDYKFASQIKPASVFRVALDTAAIFYRQYILGSYDPAGVARVSLEAAAATSPRTNGNGRSAPALRSRAEQNGHLRILYLNWRDIRNPDAGGAEIFTHEVTRRWVDQGHEVSLLTSGFEGCSSTETCDGVHVRRVGRLRSGSFHLAMQRELAQVRGFDVVIDGISTIPSLAALWKRRLPPTVALVYQLARDVWDSELPGPFAAIGRWAEPKLLRPYRDFPTVAISESTGQDLVELGFQNVVVVPPGRDEPPNLGPVEKEPVPTFMFAGRLASNKRPDHAVEAFRHIRAVLPDAQLWIAGRGPLEDDLADALPPGAELLGYVTREELYRRMARAHCLLVPSVREGWGLVVIEANSVGTPAAAYHVPGLQDSVRHGETGRLAEAGSPEDLGREAVELVADPETQGEMRRNAIEWSSRFSWNETAERLLEVVQRAPR